jgi:hypothetical protein
MLFTSRRTWEGPVALRSLIPSYVKIPGHIIKFVTEAVIHCWPHSAPQFPISITELDGAD